LCFNPRYLDFAHHHGFEIRACGVGQPQEKGRVENGVAYVKKNFLNGLELSDFKIINPAAAPLAGQPSPMRAFTPRPGKPRKNFSSRKTQPRIHWPMKRPCWKARGSTASSASPSTPTAYFRPLPVCFHQTDLETLCRPASCHDQEKLVAEHVRSYDRNRIMNCPTTFSRCSWNARKRGPKALPSVSWAESPRARLLPATGATPPQPKHQVQKSWP